MLEPVRDDALARLRQAGEGRAALDAHLAHFADFGARAVEGIRGPDEQWFLDRYFADFGNMRAAVEHAVAVENVDHAMQVSVPFADLAVHQHRFELRDWLVLALGIPGAFEHPEAVHAAGLVVSMYGIIGKSDEALVWIGKVLELVGDDFPPRVQWALAIYDGMDPDLIRAAVATMRDIETDDMLLEANIRMMISGHVRRLDREDGVAVAKENLAWARLFVEAATVHAGIQQTHIEWLRSGITPTANLERIPAEILEDGAARAASMDIADLVAYTLEALADVPDAIPTAST